MMHLAISPVLGELFDVTLVAALSCFYTELVVIQVALQAQ